MTSLRILEGVTTAQSGRHTQFEKYQQLGVFDASWLGVRCSHWAVPDRLPHFNTTAKKLKCISYTLQTIDWGTTHKLHWNTGGPWETVGWKQSTAPSVVCTQMSILAPKEKKDPPARSDEEGGECNCGQQLGCVFSNFLKSPQTKLDCRL